MTDPCDSLGLEREADAEEIRSTYRKLARQFHPDRFSGAPPADQRAAHERTQEINRALAVLTDPVERERFEREQRLRQKPDTTAARRADDARLGAKDAAGTTGRV